MKNLNIPVDEKIYPYDIRILIITLILIGVSIAFMYGASAGFADQRYHDRSYFFSRQIIYVILSMVVVIITSRMNPNIFLRLTNVFFLISVVSLILVLIPGIGVKRNGAWRWISLGVFHFQPSELSKLAIILYLSKRLSKKENDLNDLSRDILPTLFAVGLVVILVFVGKDFSSSALILGVALSLMFLAGTPLKYYFYLALTGVPFIYFLLTSFPYMKARLNMYLKKFFVDNYIQHQEMLSNKAIANSGFFGSGLGIGSFHAKIPESHTDFYFASIIADVGLLGGLIVLFLFIFLFYTLYKFAFNLREKDFSYIVLGITLLFSFQTAVNLGSVLGILPITGLPLPFLSYGGNSLLLSSFSIGMIISIARYHIKSQQQVI